MNEHRLEATSHPQGLSRFHIGNEKTLGTRFQLEWPPEILPEDNEQEWLQLEYGYIPIALFRLASDVGFFRRARISSISTNACSTENNIPFPSLANHIVPSKFWKVDLWPHGNLIITRSAWNTGKPLWPLDVRLRAARVRFSQILEYSVCCTTLAKESKEGKRWLQGHVFTLPRAYELVFSLSRLYFKTADWSLTTWIKQWKRSVVLGWAGVCGEIQNTSSPKNACVGGYL